MLFENEKKTANGQKQEGRRAGVPMQEREGGALPAADFAFSNKTNHLDLNKVQILKV